MSEEFDDLDYILQAIGNSTRRKILRLLAEEAPLTYTKIMQKLDIKDSGTLGFHLKKMSKLLRRDEFGEYRLSELGWKALKIIEQLEGRESEVPKRVEEEEEKIRVFSDHLKFEYTYKLARRLRENGVKAVFTDIVTLVIHPMDRDLFNETVKSISDVLTCYVPEDLYDDLVLKASDVFRIQKYRRGSEDIDTKKSDVVVVVKDDSITRMGFLDSIISGIVSTLTSSLTSLATMFTGEKIFKKMGKKKYIHSSGTFSGNIKTISIEISGGYIDVKEGDPKYVGWATDNGHPDVSTKLEDGELRFICSSGYIELYLPNREYDKISVELNGGGFRGLPGKAREYKFEVDGGVANIDLTLLEDGIIEYSLSGGVLKSKVDAGKGFKKVEFDISGGYLEINIDTVDKPINIDVDRMGGWVDIMKDGSRLGFKQYVRGDMNIIGDVAGGYGKILIKTRG